MNRSFICIFMSISLIFLLFPFLPPQNDVSAQTPPPASGDWIISDTTTINGQTILLNGNLRIQTSGTLNLNDCTLILNCSASKSYGIYVEGTLFSGGNFNVERTTIRANNSDYPYSFSVNGSSTMNMKASTVKNLGGNFNLTDPMQSIGGIVVYSSNVLIEDTNITDYETIGISVMPTSALTINNCNISMPVNLSGVGLTVGILDLTGGLFSPKYQNNYISGNIVSGILSIGVPVGNTFATISGNTFDQNTVGVSCAYTDPDITHNIFNLNPISGIGLLESDSEISNNEISYSASGISILNPCAPNIHDNTINNSANGIFLYNGSAVEIAKIHLNNISDNLVNGISSLVSDPEIYNNDIHNNLGSGIFLDDSSAEVHDNTITTLPISRGMIVRNDSAPNIYLNTINGEEYSAGIELDGNISMVPILANNTIKVGNNGTCIDIIGFSPEVADNELILKNGANGINATNSKPKILNNEFTAAESAIGTYITSSDVVLKYNSFEGNNIGIYASTSTPIMNSNTFTGITQYGILLNNCNEPVVGRNTFENVNGNLPGSHDNIEVEVINSTEVNADIIQCYLRLLNSTYETPSLDTGSKMQIDWFLDVYTNKPDSSIAGNVIVDLINVSGNKTDSFQTDSEGKSVWNHVTEKTMFSTFNKENSPYNIKATLGKLCGNKTIILNRSKEITIILDYNRGPSAPTDILPENTHNRTPKITWNKSIDPENDPITYRLSIGTTQGGADILTNQNTANTYYEVQKPMEFKEYHLTLSAHTPDGNSSASVFALMNVFNTKPILQPIDKKIVYLDVDPTLKFFLNATDADNDPVDKLIYNSSSEMFTLNPDTAEVTWTANETHLGTHIINFSVTDGYDIDFELVEITVTFLNKKPIADAGENITVYAGDIFVLNASLSFDPDGDIIAYTWTPNRTDLFGLGYGPIKTYKVEIAGNFSFELKVKDNNNTWSDPVTIHVSVLPLKSIPKLILGGASVNPQSGEINDNFIFTITLKGVNVTSDLLELITDENHTMIQLKLNGILTLDATRVDDISKIDTGIKYTVTVPGSMLGYGDHSFKFICNYKNVEGDLDTHQGPVIKEEKKKDDEKGLESSTLILLAFLIVIIIAVIITYFISRKRKKKEELPPPPPPPSVGRTEEEEEE